jgi:glycosyltransferase involved in cell wall biosynthesis
MYDYPQVIYVLETTQLAGGIRVVFEQANRLNRLGIPTEIYSLQGVPSWIKCEAKINTFPNYDLLGENLRSVRAFKVATFWRTASVVAANCYEGEGYYLIQDIESRFYKEPETQEAVLRTYEFPLQMLVESRWVEQQLLGLGKTCYYVGLGIDHDVFKIQSGTKRRKNCVLINAPRMNILWELKGMDILKEVITRVASQLPDVEIISFSPEEAGLEMHGINYKHWAFPTDEQVALLYNIATCFLITSRHEGFCLPALEAMACGCPVVATRADGNEEFCLHEQTCLLADQKDPDEIANAVLRILSKEYLATRLSRRGWEMAQRYRWENVISSLIHVLRLRAY